VKTASYKCVRSTDNAQVDDSKCEGIAKPNIANEKCVEAACPPTYSWRKHNSSCSVSCGSGIITQSGHCHRYEDGERMEESFCNVSQKPTTQTFSCHKEACKAPFYWKGNFGRCMATCGSGHKLKVLSCVERATGHVTENEKCKDAAIPDDEQCTMEPCKPVFETDKMPPTYAVGCYGDQPTPRRVPIYLENMKDIYDPANPLPMIQKCAEKAHSMGYVYFATQYFGECWAGDLNTAEQYYLNGYTERCENGIGKVAANFVYKIGTPESYPPVPALVNLGCYNDDPEDRSFKTHLDNFRPILDWDKKNFDDLVTKCAQSVSRRKWNVFGIQYYGECWSGENAVNTYAHTGKADRCSNGIGEVNANAVYAFVE